VSGDSLSGDRRCRLRRIDDKLLIEIAVDARGCHAAEARGTLELEGAADGGEMLAERLEGGGGADAGFHIRKVWCQVTLT